MKNLIYALLGMIAGGVIIGLFGPVEEIFETYEVEVVQKEFEGEKKRFVNARHLHKELGVGRRFATRISERIEKYNFEEGIDYFIAIPETGNTLKTLEDGKIFDTKTKKIVAKEYITTIDMAKELAMVENNEIGAVETGVVAVSEPTPEVDIFPVFTDKVNNFSEKGQKLLENNGKRQRFLTDYSSGWMEFAVNTTPADAKWSRNRSTLYFVMQNEKGEYVGGHLGDYIITNNDYGTTFRVPLNNVKTYKKAGFMPKYGKNQYEMTNFIDFLNKNDRIRIVAFYNATERASVEFLDLHLIK